MSGGENELIAIDGGQTAVKVAYGGDRLSLPGLRTNSELMPQLADAIAHVVAGGRPAPRTVAIGTTGLTAAENDPEILLGLCRDFGVERVLLAHDSVTSYLGAIGFRRGVVVASGTGVVTFGVGADRVARVDGWGNLIGDAGSGYWLGRAALDAVMRAYDGRGPETGLTEVAQRHWPDLSQAYIELQTDPGYVGLVSSFSRQVALLAPTDEVAAGICAAAGHELALSARTALVRIGEGGSSSPVVCFVGGVFRSRHVWDACVAELRQSWPEFTPVEAAGDGLAGAEALPSLPSENPLSAMVAVARA